ncbi:MAG TPA: pilus assembly protein TadG-related protein [Terriglobia bacterium]|nr:pilus assembly protein TadG-related protein [Terriglobia bacterium]
MAKNKSEAGQVLILAVLSLVVLMGLLGLGIDVGYLRHMRTKMQQAADAAALAGASEFNYGDSTAAADNDAASNGFTNGSNGTTVTVNDPPVYGGYAGNSNYVEVIIQQPQPTFFMSVLGFTRVNVAARAVGYSGASSKNCLIALGLDASTGGININADVDLLCGVAANFTLGGSGTLTAPLIGAVGGLLGGLSTSTSPVSGIPPLSDPLAYLTPPAVGGCNYNNTVISGGRNLLTPGVYCNGITISPGASATFSEGLYIINGGSLQVGTGATVTGTREGTTFYITGNASVAMNVPSTVDLVAPAFSPSPGIPAGILFYQDPSDTQPATINGTLTGTLYFPSAPLMINGADITGAVVAGSVAVNANLRITLPTGGESPIKTAVLVE